MALINEELGQPWQNIYSELSSSPIVAASLGQVYKGRLKENGDLVAVKVQRPFVLETVTIDLFIIRNLGLALRKFPQISIDVVGLVDEWAARFFEELDYVTEGENGSLFAEMMRKDLPQKVEQEKLEKLARKGPKPEETTASGSGGAPVDVKASTAASSTPPGSSTEKVSTDRYWNYAVVASTITAFGALGWYLKSGGKKQEEVQG